MAYEALYRRYRPGRFEDMIGQDHIFATLRNALIHDRVGHAYLFSGPRGTGKTSTARILAKALNCTNLQGGEPDDACDSCASFRTGQSYDLYELDAASNNGVDAMRDLIQKVALGSPGRKKVYILDEAHMLSTGAENALLKTLEEPPDHVTFVLCTTEPNKVVPTIRSRTQHLEFRLYPADELADLARSVAADAGLTVDDDGIAYAVRAAKGSARDMLSALDQVAAAGGTPDDDDQIARILDAVMAQDTGAALVAVNEATRLGRDPEVIGRGLLTDLRNTFLASMGADLRHLSDDDRTAVETRASNIGPAAVTRAIGALGTALIEMRQAPDPRVDLEVVLVRLTRPELDQDVSAILTRLERLEQGRPPAVAAPAPAAASPEPGAEPAPAPASAPHAPAPEASHPAPPSPSPPSPSQSAPAPRPEPTQARPPGARPADIARQQLRNRPDAGSAAPSAQSAPEVPPEAAGKPTLGSLRRAAAGPTANPAPAPAASAPVAPAPVAPAAQAAPAPAAPEADAAPAPPPATVATAEVPMDTPPWDEPPPEYDDASAPSGPDAAPEAPAAPSASSAGTAPDLAAVAAAWSDVVLPGLSGSVKARFSAGEFVAGADGGLEFVLPNEVHRSRCEDVRSEVDSALQNHFGAEIPIRLVAGEPGQQQAESFRPIAPTAEQLQEDESIDLDNLTDAVDDVNESVVDRIESVFPGTESIEAVE